MIKILFLIHDLGHGGAEKVLVNLVNNMEPRRFDITVMALFGGGVNEQFLKPHIRFKTVFQKSFPGNSYVMKLFSPKKLYALLIRDNYDIIVSFLEGPSARIVSGCPKSETRVVSWIHCTMHSENELAASFRSFAEAKKCYQRSDAVVFVSNEVKTSFLNICPVSCRTEVLYNTNESAKIRNKAMQNPNLIAREDGVFYWCGVGKIVPNKGFDRMIRIQKRLIDNGYKVRFYALGSGHQQEALSLWCKKNGIQDSVTFLGYQTNPYQYISRCDLYVCASHTEGFSTAATEALLLGIPVLTTDVSGMAEMLGENNEYGIIVENNEEALYNGIKELIERPEMLAYYREQSRIRGNVFRTENTVKSTQEFFESLLAGRNIVRFKRIQDMI
ncbi:glycosyltransferase [Butyricicoccus porcorum]|uniref:glycosyltransferase n=1 Tax=Butyricicoccus porcorum TaxID=1945634 RepID=UPI003F4AD24E